MLGKMIKHEFKATGRLFVPLLLIVLALTPILALLTRLASNLGEKSIFGKMLAGISTFGFVIMIVGLVIGTVIFVIVSF